MLNLKDINWKKPGLFAAGVAFGTAGIKILTSDDAKKLYTNCTAAVLRAKETVMNTVTTVQENAEDIYEGAKQINEERAEAKVAAEFAEEAEAAEEETSRPALAQAWRPFMDYNPDNGILAMATQLGETLEIYNLKDSTHKVLYGPNGEPEFKTARDGSGVPDGIMGFNDIKVTDKYIYAVFQGMKLKDELAAYKQGKELEDGGRFIYVFDLKGNPVQKYTLDHAIHGIDVNEETNTIVATEVKSDDPIIEFKI